MQACSHAFRVANASSHAYSAPWTASTAHSPPTAFRAAPCAYPSQRARTVETTLPPTHPSAGAQVAHQPWPLQPRDPYDATTPLTLPGPGYISAGQTIAQNAGDRGYRHGQSPETGTARLFQAPSQSVGHRTGSQVTSGFDQPVLVTARDEASTPRPQNQIPRLMSDETRLGRKGILWYTYTCLILARSETRRNIPKENFISDGANFGWCVYLRCMLQHSNSSISRSWIRTIHQISQPAATARFTRPSIPGPHYHAARACTFVFKHQLSCREETIST